MRIHMVGGFLGSGKTTAISQAAKILVGRNKRVGIITNDQGKHLVDTAFYRAQDFPALEVTGGCFCCNFNDLSEQIEKIAKEYNPDILFAESVGSCADIVATVVKPLQEIRNDLGEAASYSVFVDVRLLERFLEGSEMPFSEDVSYIFAKQIEEASNLIINKIDLMDEERVSKVAAMAGERYPRAVIVLQNSLDEKNVEAWLELIEGKALPTDLPSLEIDYDRYASGEQEMAWVDSHYAIEVEEDRGLKRLAGMVIEIVHRIDQIQHVKGHLKFQIEGNGRNAKVSVPTLHESDDAFEKEVGLRISNLGKGKLQLWINALIVGNVERLQATINEIMFAPSADSTIKIEELESFTRVPGYPKPTYRIN